MTKKQLVELWLAEFTGKDLFSLCSLCGNTGILDTRESAISPRGARVGKLHYCICPNGRAMKKSEVPLEPWPPSRNK